MRLLARALTSPRRLQMLGRREAPRTKRRPRREDRVRWNGAVCLTKGPLCVNKTDQRPRGPPGGTGDTPAGFVEGCGMVTAAKAASVVGGLRAVSCPDSSSTGSRCEHCARLSAPVCVADEQAGWTAGPRWAVVWWPPECLGRRATCTVLESATYNVDRRGTGRERSGPPRERLESRARLLGSWATKLCGRLWAHCRAQGQT